MDKFDGALGDIALLTIKKILGGLGGSSYDEARQHERLERIEHVKSMPIGQKEKRLTRFPHSHVREPLPPEPKSKQKPVSQSRAGTVTTQARPDEYSVGSLYSAEPISIDTLRKALPARFASLDSNTPDP